MLKLLKNNFGQMMTVQYAMTFFFVVAVVVGMTVYFKRVMQARIHDATFYMASTVQDVYGNNKAMFIQYEPYYTDTYADRSTSSQRADTLLGVFNTSSGMYVSDSSSRTVGTSGTNQAPPSAAW